MTADPPPHDAEALCRTGNAHFAAGRLPEAAHAYRSALALRPDFAEAEHNLGLALQNLGASADAEAAFRHALELQPGSALVLNSLGDLLRCMGRLPEAEKVLHAALRAAPQYPDAHNNLAIVLQQAGRTNDALQSFQRALDLAPSAPQVHVNLAIALLRTGDSSGAESACLRAIALKPDYAEAYFNLGVSQERQGRVDDAEQSYRHTIEIQPGFAVARANLSLILLARGAFREGFREYEWTVRAAWGDGYLPDPANPTRPLGRPSTKMPADWRGKRLLLVHDQGIGDEIFFLRFVPRLRDAGAHVTVCPSPKLFPLLARSGWVDALADAAAPLPPFDFAFATSDLATLAEAADAEAPPLPLAALPDRVAAARARLSSFGPPPWIGVTWRAGAGSRPADSATLLAKSIDPFLLEQALAPLDARIFLLQRAPATGERARFEAALGRVALDLPAAGGVVAAAVDDALSPANLPANRRRVLRVGRPSSRHALAPGQMKKPDPSRDRAFFVWPGGDLLSRANAHYHRRKPVSRSCSGWEGVVPSCCGRQIDDRAAMNRQVHDAMRPQRAEEAKAFWIRDRAKREAFNLRECSSHDAHGYRVKPHGQLVLVS